MIKGPVVVLHHLHVVHMLNNQSIHFLGNCLILTICKLGDTIRYSCAGSSRRRRKRIFLLEIETETHEGACVIVHSRAISNECNSWTWKVIMTVACGLNWNPALQAYFDKFRGIQLQVHQTSTPLRMSTLRRTHLFPSRKYLSLIWPLYLWIWWYGCQRMEESR